MVQATQLRPGMIIIHEGGLFRCILDSTCRGRKRNAERSTAIPAVEEMVSRRASRVRANAMMPPQPASPAIAIA